jgi:hypothetical protein
MYSCMREAVCLAHLRAVGAIIIGKTKLCEVKADNQDNPGNYLFFKHSFSMSEGCINEVCGSSPLKALKLLLF